MEYLLYGVKLLHSLFSTQELAQGYINLYCKKYPDYSNIDFAIEEREIDNFHNLETQ